jgi:hypothetical protein
MEISGTERQAIVVALKAAAQMYKIGNVTPTANTANMSPALKRSEAQFAFVCENLADQFERLGKVDLNEENYKVVTAALRLSCKRWFDMAQHELVKFEREKKLAFSLSYDTLADRIDKAAAAAMRRKPQLKQQ